MARIKKSESVIKADTERFLFEVELKQDYENLHVLNKVNDALERSFQAPHSVKKMTKSQSRNQLNESIKQRIKKSLSSRSLSKNKSE